MSPQVPNVKLSNGVGIPILGLGTYKATGDDVKNAVETALELGYRHFDTADYYKNLHIIGPVLNSAISSGRVTRSELFITSKVWCTDYASAGRVLASVRRQLSEAGLDYFDLVLLHWPMVFADSDDVLVPRDASGAIALGDRPLPEIYAELEQAQTLSLARSIGVSNFNSEQVKLILDHAKVPPVMNQVECHIYLAQQKLQAFCAQHGIALTAYCPIGRGSQGPSIAFNLLENETLKSIASKYHKSPAQIAIRYLLQRGIIAIPKSVQKTRLEENFTGVLDFAIKDEDMQTLLGLDSNQRLVLYPDAKHSPNFPFLIEF